MGRIKGRRRSLKRESAGIVVWHLQNAVGFAILCHVWRKGHIGCRGRHARARFRQMLLANAFLQHEIRVRVERLMIYG